MLIELKKNKCKIDLTIRGKGKPILFLHGWGQNKNSFSSLAEMLSEEFKTICISFPPFGNSSKLVNPLSIYNYASIVEELIEKLKLNSITIICHSFGGRVAILIGANPRIEKIVFIDSAGVKPKFSFITWLKIKKYKFLKFLVKRKIILEDKLKNSGSADYKQLNIIEKQSFVKIVNCHLNSKLSFISAKCLIIFGKNDKITPVYMAKYMRRKIKNSELSLIDNCAHFCFLENLPKVYSLIRSFLND